ncbi:50S ribosomal protein L25 [Siminovitchia terrae]|uniref:Large ribosomal subunit protein bL25 n=1 Tax=Siminovitchia terrae TaxID=1914933 RepID=A0A429X2Y8_SIMTE|nr:50S ribosomal protein L25/general stress protein Ctc [Siminovitchia terrae]RST57732.1 50S ribosomal protein L25/general stress protein Ctc [Siminovitchia terrae]GIN93510.1 50S ribosomal protein L25 [Siminovitchia terrae]GIN99179.1 50S ribosomal protein L25 [Siminovitchia terrae]
MVNVLKAKERTSDRHSQIRELREQGGIPAIVYGYKTENTPISINNAEFTKTMREVGRNGVISLDVEGKKLNVVLHEYQEDPIKKEVIHADFLAVDMSQEIEANVRVELSEDAEGVRNGGVLQQILHEVVVTAKPDEIPEVISVDISGLGIGETISIAEIRGNYSITINHEDDEPIATILAPRVEEPAEEGAEPAGEAADSETEEA